MQLFDIFTLDVGLQIAISIVGSYLLVILFNWYNLGNFSIKPRLHKAWLKIPLISVSVFFVVNAIFQTSVSDKIDFSGFQNLPNYLMFFATVLSVYLLYRALTSERKASQLSAFENRFFKFMDYHRENVRDLKYRDPTYKGERYWEGIQVFTVIYYEIIAILKDIEKRRPSNTDRNKKAENINQAFQCIFYGAGNTTLQMLKKKFKVTNLGKFERKVAAYSNDSLKEDRKEKVYYSGHVGRLGHYFRNIYQMVKYVESREFLTPNQKYQYITHFRAQMSVYEQAVFFFNSLSELGSVWEWENYSKDLPADKEARKKLYNRLLITKYDFVRNTLDNDGVIADGVSITSFYPLINLERNPESKICSALPFRASKEICRYCFNEKYIGYKNENTEEKILEAFSNPTKEDVESFGCKEKDCITKRELSKLIKKNSSNS